MASPSIAPTAQRRNYLLIDESWLGLFTNKRGAGTADTITCLTFACIYEWYNPFTDKTTGEQRVRFAGEQLQLQTADIAQKLNLSAKSVNDALNTLAKRGLITRTSKDVQVNGRVLQERQYIYLHLDAMAEQGFITDAQADTIAAVLGARYAPMVYRNVDNSQREIKLSTNVVTNGLDDNELSTNVCTNGLDVCPSSKPKVREVVTNGVEGSLPMVEHTCIHIHENNTQHGARDFSLKISLPAAVALLKGWGVESARAEQLAGDYMAQADAPCEEGLKEFAGFAPASQGIVSRIDERITEILKKFSHPSPEGEPAQRTFRRDCDSVKRLAKDSDVLAFVYAQFQAYCKHKEATKSKLHGTAGNFVSSLLEKNYEALVAQSVEPVKTVVRDLGAQHVEKTFLQELQDKMRGIARNANMRNLRVLPALLESSADYVAQCTTQEERDALIDMKDIAVAAIMDLASDILASQDASQAKEARVALQEAWRNTSNELLKREICEMGVSCKELELHLIHNEVEA